jgi:predicted phage gp36 major capsid-like protein
MKVEVYNAPRSIGIAEDMTTLSVGAMEERDQASSETKARLGALLRRLDVVRDDLRAVKEEVKRDIAELKRDFSERKALVRFTNCVALNIAGVVGTAALVSLKAVLHW